MTFAVDDVYALDADDETFDVVHAHQVLQHLSDPVAALVEMRRVLVPGGLLAVRDSDYAAFVWAPEDPLLDRWLALYHEVVRANGAEADAGRFLKGWVLAAGFADVEVRQLHVDVLRRPRTGRGGVGSGPTAWCRAPSPSRPSTTGWPPPPSSRPSPAPSGAGPSRTTACSCSSTARCWPAAERAGAPASGVTLVA